MRTFCIPLWLPLALLCSLFLAHTYTLASHKPPSPPRSRPLWQPNIPPLQLSRVIVIQPPSPRRFDPSGLFFDPLRQRLLTVNDKLHTLQIFELPIPTTPPAHNHSTHTHPPTTTPHPTSRPSPRHVLKARRFWHSTQNIPRPFSKDWPNHRLTLDLEGVTACHGQIFVVAEQLRTIFRIKLKTGKITQHPLDIPQYERRAARHRNAMPRFSIDPNTGYEGITCDPKHRHLYVIQERQPRLILKVKMPTSWKDRQPLYVLDHFDLPALGFPKASNGVNAPPDFAGADLRDGFLYVLFRNARAVMKVDLNTHQLLSVFQFQHHAHRLFRSRLPFGMAEGLALSKDKIWIIFDNNRKPQRLHPQDRRPLLLEFHRPKGF